MLYLALEDGPRRLQRRLVLQRTGEEPLRGLPLSFIMEFPPLDAGGLAVLEREISAARPALVILDTLAAAKTGRLDENAAGPMADLANGLRHLAQVHDTTILVVAHHGKGSYADPGHDLRGSSALAAAADVNLGLYKTETGHSLRGEGRDLGGV